MKRFLSLLFGRVFLIVLAALCVGLLIWFGGPLVAVADWRPLETQAARIGLIAVLLILWLGGTVVRALRQKLANRKLFEALGRRRDAQGAVPDADAAKIEAIRSRFSSAMAALKSARLGRPPGLVERIFGGRRFVYQLPWYVFIGPPGSGKTTALLNSGLQFPLAEQLGNDPVRGIGGTRNCDWWFTDQAIMIDTAGRYTTQDSDAESDSSEWREFLSLLRRHRPRQPINGALVTVSVADLLQLSQAERTAQAAAVRSRVQELSKTLDIQFPVYLLVTKVDLLPGFVEFFDAFDRDQRQQVWGATFAYQPDETGVSPGILVERFDELLRRIDALTLDRLQAERDPHRRAAIHGFLHQLASIGDPLAEFVAAAFPRTQLARMPVLRGFYLTSGTQEGSPIDRVMGSLARQFGLQRRVLPPLRPTGKSFFLTRLLHGVIFPEAPLAGTNLRWERRLDALKWTGSIAALLVAAVAISGWTWSYLNNVGYVADVAGEVNRIKTALSGRVAGSIELNELLPLYQDVQSLPRTETVDPNDPRLSYGLGLFQGRKLAQAADQSYYRLLEQTLAPMIATRMAEVLRRGAATPELQYETLKTYVMLREPDRLNPAAVTGWVAFDLEVNRAGSLSAEQSKTLLRHVENLLARSGFQDSVRTDAELIQTARAGLARTPFPQRVYDRLKRQGVGDFPDFRISKAGGPLASAVFVRASGRSLNDGVPGLYTYDGYHKGFAKALDEVITVLAAEEVWVLGIKDSENARRAADPLGRRALVDEVKRLYLRDYAAIWERFIADIALVRGGSLSETIQSARILSAPDSPLPVLLRAIVREVSLTEGDGKGVVDKAVDKAAEAVKDTRQTLGRLLGSSAPAALAPAPKAQIESIVDDRFEGLRRLVRAPQGGGAAPIDQTLALINDLYQLMSTTETVVRGGGAPPASDVPNKVKSESGRLPEPVRSMLATLAASGATQALGATRTNISRDMATTVGEFCRKAIEGRYPFARESKEDVRPDDFAKLFGPGGVLDDFFQKNLAAFVDTTVKPWRFRKVGDSSMGDSASLVQFQRAAEIRNVFFSGGARGPSLRVEMKPTEMDPSILVFNLDVDGQVLRYAHGPAVPKTMQWPGPKGSNQIRVQVSPPGASGTSGQVFEGPWALFRMFDRAQIDSGSQPERFRATFVIDDRRVQFEVTTNSVQNPFRLRELQEFRCPSRL